MPLLQSNGALLHVVESDAQSVSPALGPDKSRLVAAVDRTADAMIEKAIAEAVGLLNEPYAPDEISGGGFLDIISGSSAYDAQQGLDFQPQIRMQLIWRARWASRVYPMAKQALSIFTSFCIQQGIPKPLTKATRQATRQATPPDAPPADQKATAVSEAPPVTAPTDQGRHAAGTPPRDPIQQVLDDLWADPDNAQFATHGGLEETLRHRQVDGCLLWALFVDDQTGHVKARRVDPVRLVDIITDPQDGVRPLYYRLRPTQTTQDISAADSMGGYQAGQSVPGSVQATMANAPIPGMGVALSTSDVFFRDWENTDPERDPFAARMEALEGYTQGACMAHFPINRLGKFGLSELFAGGDFLRAHKRFNENRATLTEALRRIALLLTVKGGQQQVSAAQMQLQSSLTSAGLGGASGWESNPAPAAGSLFASNPGMELSQFKVETGGAEAAADGEMLLQMWAASVGLATHYFGSSQMHTLASSTSMELPILRYLQSAQKGIADMLRQLVDFSLREAVRAKQLPGATLVQKFGYEMVEWGNLDPSYDVEMPPVINEDPQQSITPLVAANQAGLLDDETAAHKVLVILGSENVDEQLARWQTWHADREAQQQQNALALKTAGPGMPPAVMPGDSQPHTPGGPSTAETQRARRRLREVAASGEHRYQFASTQFDLPDDIAAVFRHVAAGIADDDLAQDGREDTPHITLLYGLHDTSPATMEAIHDLCAKTAPLTLTFGPLDVFPPSQTGEDYAVLKAPVMGTGLRTLRTALAKKIPNTQTHAGYKPHATLAYLTPDAVARYVGMDPFKDVTVVLDTLTVSDRDGKTHEIPLLGSAKEEK